ncbi:MAG: hypothetical protein HY776_04965, partial [Actinobacteria bacterium]|nr:hypothetical protein [Actinomycetota bacterium]
MRFSERYDYKIVDKALLKTNVPESIRTSIWNVFYLKIFKHVGDKTTDEFIRLLWQDFFRKDLFLLDRLYGEDFFVTLGGEKPVISNVQEAFFSAQWFEVYDFIEFFNECFRNPSKTKLKTEILQSLNTVFKEERVPYRVVNGLVTPLTSEEEIKVLEAALNVPDKFKSVRDHI